MFPPDSPHDGSFFPKEYERNEFPIDLVHALEAAEYCRFHAAQLRLFISVLPQHADDPDPTPSWQFNRALEHASRLQKHIDACNAEVRKVDDDLTIAASTMGRWERSAHHAALLFARRVLEDFTEFFPTALRSYDATPITIEIGGASRLVARSRLIVAHASLFANRQRSNEPDPRWCTDAIREMVLAKANRKGQPDGPEGGWSRPISPAELCKIYNCGQDKLVEDLKKQKIRNFPLSTKRYLIAMSHLPEAYKERYGSIKKDPKG